MRDNITLGLAIAAFLLSAWNFWKSHWGKTPGFAFEVEYRDSGRFLLRNVGRRRATIKNWAAVPHVRTTLPEMFELGSGATKPFTFTLDSHQDEDAYPGAIYLTVARRNIYGRYRFDVPVPFSAAAFAAVRHEPPPRIGS